MVPGLQHKKLKVRDGTEIALQVRGPEDAPAIVLANGLGGTYEAFRYLYRFLGERYRIVCWDYRGLYRSGRPRDLATLAVEHQVRDLVEILDAERIQRAVLVGWSMGVQVNFEMLRADAGRVAGMVSMNGTYGTPFRTALASRLARYIIPPALSLMKANANLVSRTTQVAVGWDGLIRTMARFGLVSYDIDEEAMRDVAQDFKTLDFAIYSDTLRRLGEHDAREVLPRIAVPVLIITGDQDLMTPVFTARKMNRLIPGSRLVVIAGGSHYTPLEYPHIIEDEVRRFLDGVPGWETRGRRSSPQVERPA
jgi:pimeloyl-ACP methyl ester carboxylesterase